MFLLIGYEAVKEEMLRSVKFLEGRTWWRDSVVPGL
jgi:hypothetical protein